MPPASPMPTPIRARNSCQKFWARPQAAVNRLHSATDAGDDVDPALAVGEPGDRDGEAAIEEREGDPAHRLSCRVADRPNSSWIGTREDADDLPVDEVEDVGEEQDQEDARTDRAIGAGSIGHRCRRWHGGGGATSPAARRVPSNGP